MILFYKNLETIILMPFQELLIIHYAIIHFSLFHCHTLSQVPGFIYINSFCDPYIIT